MGLPLQRRSRRLVTQHDVQPVLATAPVQGNDPDSAASRALRPYNQAIRELAEEHGVMLADINRAMTYRHNMQIPDDRLTFDGERFNRAGSQLMAETLMQAMDLGDLVTPRVRGMWDTRRFYAE